MRLTSIRRFAGVSLINLAYLVLQTLLFLVLTPWILWVLGPQVYGLWTIIVAIMGFAGLANFSVQAAAVKYVAQFSTSAEMSDQLSVTVTFGAVFLLATGALASLVLWALRHGIARSVEVSGVSSELLSQALGVVAIGLVPLFLMQLANGILLGLVRNEVAGGLGVAQNAILLVGALVVGLRHGGILELALWTLVVNWTMCAVSLGVAFRNLHGFRLRLAWDSRLVREMLRYSLFAWFSTLGSTLFTSADRILVGMFLGSTAAGAYGVCTGVAIRLNQLAGAFTQLYVPFTSSYQAAGRIKEIQSAFKYGSRLTACLLVGAATILLVWANPILTMWISPQFSSAYVDVFQILVACYAIFSMAGPGYQMALGLGRADVTAIVGAAGSFAMVFLILVLAPPFGLTGVAFANLGYVVVLGVQFYVARLLQLKPISTVLDALGLPVLTLIALILVIRSVSLSVPMALLITVAMLAITVWIALGDGTALRTLRVASMDSASHK